MRKPPILLALGLAVSGCSTPAYFLTVTDKGNYDPISINTVPAAKPLAVIPYGNQSPAQVGELRLPKGRGPFPVAMVVHGGCWIKGMGSPRNTAALSAWLADRGVATWNIDYRELGNGGGWTSTFEDWAMALAQLKPLARKYPLDLKRVSIIGHSAGATAAAWLAGSNKGDAIVARDLPKVRTVVLLDGPARIGDLAGLDKSICGRPVVAELMGGTAAEVPACYAMVDPLRNQPQVKTFVVVQGQLPIVPELAETLTERGINSPLVKLGGNSHFDVLAPGTRDFATMAPVLLFATGGK